MCAIALVWLEAWWLPGLLGFVPTRPVGEVLFWSGLVLAGVSAVSFLKARSTIIPHQTPSRLITGGAYRFSRNPIYLADVLILLGVTFKWGAVLGIVLAPVFMAVITARFIRPEEARLRAAFGAEAEAFFARTRRWL
jgi:protein-S-isoprenylcysteine O-methyltransferase Ste14